MSGNHGSGGGRFNRVARNDANISQATDRKEQGQHCLTVSVAVGHPVEHGFSLLFLPLSLFDCLFKEPRGRERKGFVREGQTDGVNLQVVS